MAEPASPKGLVIGAPRSGSGKTLVTLGLIGALRQNGLAIAPAKTGPDYIDGAFHARAAGRETINLDPWAMAPDRLCALAAAHATGSDLLLVEGVMGLFDGASDGTGSTGDLAAHLMLPVLLVVDCERQSQSVAPLVAGFARWRNDVRITGLILNRVGSARHGAMLTRALAPLGIAVVGALPRAEALSVPSRHLGLTLPGAIETLPALLDAAATQVAAHCDLNAIAALATPLAHPTTVAKPLPPLGQRIAIARDEAFAFLYPHWLADWRAAGTSHSFFSPLADEAPSAEADAILLPGGYPELFAARLAAASAFKAGLRDAAARGALVYGECGGFMCLGETLTDAAGVTHAMAGLLPLATRIDRPRRVLGYRRLVHRDALPWPQPLSGHEFHYSSGTLAQGVTPLFAATDAEGLALPAMGARLGSVMGSYAHVIDRGDG